MRAAGLQARISSIHVNGWFGDYGKLAMTQRLLAEVFKCEAGTIRRGAAGAGFAELVARLLGND